MHNGMTKHHTAFFLLDCINYLQASIYIETHAAREEMQETPKLNPLSLKNNRSRRRGGTLPPFRSLITGVKLIFCLKLHIWTQIKSRLSQDFLSIDSHPVVKTFQLHSVGRLYHNIDYKSMTELKCFNNTPKVQIQRCLHHSSSIQWDHFIEIHFITHYLCFKH